MQNLMYSSEFNHAKPLSFGKLIRLGKFYFTFPFFVEPVCIDDISPHNTYRKAIFQAIL